MSFIIILGAVISTILMVAALAVGLQSGHTRRHLDQRLGAISGKGGGINPAGLDENLRRRGTTSKLPILDRLVQAWLPNPDRLRDRLARTGRELAWVITLYGVLARDFSALSSHRGISSCPTLPLCCWDLYWLLLCPGWPAAS